MGSVVLYWHMYRYNLCPSLCTPATGMVSEAASCFRVALAACRMVIDSGPTVLGKENPTNLVSSKYSSHLLHCHVHHHCHFHDNRFNRTFTSGDYSRHKYHSVLSSVLDLRLYNTTCHSCRCYGVYLSLHPTRV